MQIRLWTAIFLSVAVLLPALSHGEIVTEKGMATVRYENKRGPSPEELLNAREFAAKNAIERWVAKGSVSTYQNFELLREEILGRVADYTLDASVVSEEVDSDSRTVTVVVRASINGSRLTSDIDGHSSVANAAPSEKSYLAFVFLAREEVERKMYRDRDFSRTDTSTSETGEEVEAASRSGFQYASSTDRSESLTTGGSTTRKSDAVMYDVAPASEVNLAMTEVFTTAGFEPIEAEYLEEESGGLVSVSRFAEDFSRGDDISGSTRRSAAEGARLLDIPYLAVGTLDMGMHDRDPATGLIRTHVSVTGKVIDVTSRFPRTIAGIGPVLYAGLGPNVEVARTNALKEASQNAARELVQQLNSKGIR